MESFTSYLITFLLLFNKVTSRCHLPNQWNGMWYQSNEIDLLKINKTNFMNRGICIEHKQDKFLFFEKDECYRCIFIMQKHINVIQYRTSYCSEQKDFDFNCQNLSPESELFTIYRDNSLPEKCPLEGLYAIQSTKNNDGLFQSFPKKCEDKNSAITQCADQSMLKLNFGRCTSMPNYVINCIAHWSEGNTNYLIGRVERKNQKPIYKCLAYMESTQSSRTLRNQNFIDLIKNRSHKAKDILQVLISQDEFCRNIDNIIDDQLSFKFKKIYDSENTLIKTNSNVTREQRSNQGSNYNVKCKFPRWLNKKWHDLKQIKSYGLNYHLDSLIITQDKNSLVMNKHSCWHLKSRKPNYFQAVVKSLNGCASGFQCVTISSKSDYVVEIKFSKLNNNSIIDCSNENYEMNHFAYVDTNYGVKCPLKSGKYQRINSKMANQRSIITYKDYENINMEECKFLTQSQTLQVGCQSSEQYSLRTKLCYPNNQQYKREKYISHNSILKTSTASFTQLESEINLVCLAYWTQNGKNIIISRTMSNEILCSIWSFSQDEKKLKLLQIDSNCNYDKESNSHVNYEFVYIDSCQNELSQFKSFIKSYIKNSKSKLEFNFTNLLLFYLFIFFI